MFKLLEKPLLIEPLGIETRERRKRIRRMGLLIEPLGIETRERRKRIRRMGPFN